MSVSVDPTSGSITGSATLTIGRGGLQFDLNPALELTATRANGKSVKLNRDARVVRIGRTKGAVTLRWSGDAKAIHGSFVDERYVHLPDASDWYPQFEGGPLPSVAVAESWEVIAQPEDDGEFVAGDWERMEVPGAPIPFSVLRFRDTSIKQAQRWQLAGLRAYEQWHARLGRFPHEGIQFAEVPDAASATARAVAIPTRVFRQTPLDEALLADRLVESWIGFGVRDGSDDQAAFGGWAAGLRHYLLNFRYGAPDSAPKARYASLVRHANRSSDETEQPERAAMVFHMLERQLGLAIFDQALRQLVAEKLGGQATWADWREAMSRAFKHDVSVLFDGWVTSEPAPIVRLEAVKGRVQLDESAVDVLVSCEPACRGRIPLTVRGTGTEAMRRSLRINGTKGSQRFTVPFPATTVVLDPEYDFMRTLENQEQPATLSRSRRDEVDLVILGTARDRSMQNAARTAAPMVVNRHAVVRYDHQVTRDLVANAERFWIVGLPVEGFFERMGIPRAPQVELEPELLRLNGEPAVGNAAVAAAHFDAATGYDYVILDAVTPSAMLDLSRRIEEFERSTAVLMVSSRVLLDVSGAANDLAAPTRMIEYDDE